MFTRLSTKNLDPFVTRGEIEERERKRESKLGGEALRCKSLVRNDFLSFFSLSFSFSFFTYFNSRFFTNRHYFYFPCARNTETPFPRDSFTGSVS